MRVAQFVAYHVDSSGANSAPIAVGTSYNECHAAAVVNVVKIGATDGVMRIQERNDMPEPIYRALSEFLMTYFGPAEGSA